MGVTSYIQGHDTATLQSHQSRSAANQAGYMLHVVKPDSKILDVGCGPGTITCDFAKLVSQGNVVGVDFSEDVLQIARKEAVTREIANLTFQTASALELPFADETFDVVHCHALLSHVPNARKALAEMHRVCKTGGYVAAREPDFGTLVIHPPDPGLSRWQELHVALKRKEGASSEAGRHLADWAVAAGFATEKIKITSNVLQYASKDERKWWGELSAARAPREFGKRAIESGLASQEDIDGIMEAYTQWSQCETGIWALMHMMLLCQK